MTAPVGRELSCSTPAAAPLYLKKYKVVNKVILMFSCANIYCSTFIIYSTLEARYEMETYFANLMNQVDASSGWERPDPCFPCLQGYLERSFAFFSELLTGWRKTSRIKMSANWKTCSGWCGYTEKAKTSLHSSLLPHGSGAPSKDVCTP